jgi:short-subunit dehydrogenase
MNVKDKTAIVTGASSGIGLATAKLLSNKGAKVALVSRSKDKLEKLSKEIPNSIAFATDMSKVFEVKRMIKAVFDRFGRIDLLINNAGVGYDALTEKIDLDTYHYIFDLDLVGPIAAMQQVIPLMRAGGGGTIINISSAVALMNLANNAPYASIKRALSVVSLTAREELKQDKIVVSVVYPYITLTDFERNTIRDVPVPESELEPHGPFPPDSVEYAAQKIVAGVESGEAEIFAHDWIRDRALGKIH